MFTKFRYVSILIFLCLCCGSHYLFSIAKEDLNKEYDNMREMEFELNSYYEKKDGIVLLVKIIGDRLFRSVPKRSTKEFVDYFNNYIVENKDFLSSDHFFISDAINIFDSSSELKILGSDVHFSLNAQNDIIINSSLLNILYNCPGYAELTEYSVSKLIPHQQYSDANEDGESSLTKETEMAIKAKLYFIS